MCQTRTFWPPFDHRAAQGTPNALKRWHFARECTTASNKSAGTLVGALPTGVLSLRFLSGVIFGIYVIDTPRPSAVDLDDGFFIREGIVRHAGRKREEASSRQRLGVALIRNVAHAERKRARDNGHDFRLRVGVRGNGIALRELEAKHEQAVFSRVAVEYARFSPRRNRRGSLRPFYILRPKHRVIHALGRRWTGQGDQAGNDGNLNHFHVIPPCLRPNPTSRPNSIPKCKRVSPSHGVLQCRSRVRVRRARTERIWCNLVPELPSGGAELLISRQRRCRRQASSLSADLWPSRLDQPCLSTRTSVRDSTRHLEADHETRTLDSHRRSNYRCAEPPALSRRHRGGRYRLRYRHGHSRTGQRPTGLQIW